MSMRNKGLLCGRITVSVTGIVGALYTIFDLMIFLSYLNSKTGPPTGHQSGSWSLKLFYNTLLVSLFIFSHTFLALPGIKELFKKLYVQDIQRSVYILLSCITLQILMKGWQYTDFYIWNFGNQNLTWWTCSIFHLFSWTFIYIGCICMDIGELLGFKQAYYTFQNLPEPMNYKSNELQRLYTHIRHPSFLAFVIIFWVVPVMSLDRFILSTITTIYMFVAWNTDDVDYNYQRIQYHRKFNKVQ